MTAPFFFLTRLATKSLLIFCEVDFCLKWIAGSATNVVTVVAGTYGASGGFDGDGTATTHKLKAPTDVKFDPFGGLYISDNENDRIRKIDLAGNTMTTVAGCGSTRVVPTCLNPVESPPAIPNGDGGPATTARGFRDQKALRSTASETSSVTIAP